MFRTEVFSEENTDEGPQGHGQDEDGTWGPLNITPIYFIVVSMLYSIFLYNPDLTPISTLNLRI